MITDADVLVELVKDNQKQGMVVAEVGVFEGGTTINYAPIIKENNGLLYLIDWFCGCDAVHSEHVHGYKPNMKSTVRHNLEENLKLVGCDVCSVILEGKSFEIAKNIPDQTFDIVYLDADHRYGAIKADILAYLPKVKAGGIIAGHDCENINLANTFKAEELEMDTVFRNGRSVHAGVIQAVYDVFGFDVEIRDNTPPAPVGLPSWIKRL